MYKNMTWFELSPYFGPILKHRYSEICVEQILKNLNGAKQQISRIYDPNRIAHCYGNLNNRFKTIAEALGHTRVIELLVKDIQFLFTCLRSCMRFLDEKGGKNSKDKSLKAIVMQSSLPDKNELAEKIKAIGIRYNDLNYKEGRDFDEHLDEKIKLNTCKELIASRISESFSFPGFDPNLGKFSIQRPGEDKIEIDISESTVLSFCESVYDFCDDLRISCEKSLSEYQREFLKKNQELLCSPFPEQP